MDYEFFADTTTNIDKQALINYFTDDGRYIQEEGLDGHNKDTHPKRLSMDKTQQGHPS